MKLFLSSLPELIFVFRVCMSIIAFDCLSFGVLDQDFGLRSFLSWWVVRLLLLFLIGFDLITPVMIHNAWFWTLWRVCWCVWAVIKEQEQV
jgi:hypothetical protein